VVDGAEEGGYTYTIEKREGKTFYVGALGKCDGASEGQISGPPCTVWVWDGPDF
jgi:hypothetical protein